MKKIIGYLSIPAFNWLKQENNDNVKCIKILRQCLISSLYNTSFHKDIPVIKIEIKIKEVTK